MSKDLSKLLKFLGLDIGNKRLIVEAMTHKSYSSENDLDFDNQRLEFLGDAVLQIVITEYLYTRYPQEQEGKLTKMRSALARQAAFAELAKKMELGEYIMMGKGEIRNGGKDRISTLCDAFEALAGAVYLDAGLDPVTQIVMPMLQDSFPDPSELLIDLNPKGMLQEYTQKHCKSERPEYIIENKEGPDHECEYSIAVAVKGKVIGRGKGKSRKSAEMNSATNALSELKEVMGE
jgi:ribonuclease-3